MTLFAFYCTKCGYRGSDVFPEKVKEPRTLKLRVEKREDLNILIARSSTATIRIPEIGAEINPGPASQGFITTVEGIPVHSTFSPEITEKISAFAASLLEKAKNMIKEIGGSKITFITLDTSSGELLIAAEQEYVIAILR